MKYFIFGFLVFLAFGETALKAEGSESRPSDTREHLDAESKRYIRKMDTLGFHTRLKTILDAGERTSEGMPALTYFLNPLARKMGTAHLADLYMPIKSVNSSMYS
mgnify:FL=1|jgi:hypothetical protein